jgi:hypothetical protein
MVFRLGKQHHRQENTMSIVKVRHPNPTLQLAERTLAHQECMVSVTERCPTFSNDNVAFTSAHAMLAEAADRAAAHPNSFKVVAWAHVNGSVIDPIGFVMFNGWRFMFTPINHGNEDAEAGRQGWDANDIACELNRINREDPDRLIARQWTHVRIAANEAVDEALFNRVASVLSFLCLSGRREPGTDTSMEALFELAV